MTSLFILDDLEAIEPLIESLSIGKEDCSAFFRSLLNEAVRSKVSYFVKGNDGKIAGVRLSTFLTRSETDRETEYTPTPELSPNLERAQCLLWHLNRQFWQNMSPDIEKVYYLMAVILAPQFRYTDLADKLVHHNMDEVIYSL
ncbi:unnamed protein product [Cylicostephanus goldi]|uniref:Uncharacterized protein n=1 Tax=Cylicostephanus goldi TaxID=71465 RepID=A0A3P7N0W5_CYLGO|nr:unnamed protein product [Cylicostephanus goldi]